MIYRRNVLIAAVAALGALGSATSYAQETLAQIQKKGVAKIAILADFPPFAFVDKNMQPQGMDVDVANEISKRLGAKPELIRVLSANRIPSLQAEKVDFLVASVAKSPDREKVVDFTLPYAPYYQAVFGRKSIDVKSYSDLAGKTVAVARGTTQDENLQKVAPAETRIVRFESSSDAIQAIVSGQTQFIAMGSSIIGPVMKQHPKAEIEYKLLLKDSPNYIAVRKGDEPLRTKINEILKEMRADGTLEGLSKKWLGEGLDSLEKY